MYTTCLCTTALHVSNLRSLLRSPLLKASLFKVVIQILRTYTVSEDEQASVTEWPITRQEFNL